MELANIQYYIDSRNIKLWQELQYHFEIKVYNHDLPESKLFSANKSVQIYLGRDATSSDFTHELLHLLLEKQGIDIGQYINNRIIQSKKLQKILTKPLLDHIGNVCDHAKIFPIYKSLGFSEEVFLFDNQVNKCTTQEIRNIEKYFRFLMFYSSAAIDAFIGKYFAAKANHNKDIDYTICLQRLENVDNELFKVLSNFWHNWNNFNLHQEINIAKNLATMAGEFIDNLTNWLRGKWLI